MAITAGMVKALRDKTGLPMMECKKALTEAGGDEDQAIEVLKKMGAGKIQKMATREATEGRIACHVGPDGAAGIVELRCETAPVAGHEDFVALANGIAGAVSACDGPSAETIRDAKSGCDASKTVGDCMDEVFNRMRENMKVARVAKLTGHTGSYTHHNGQVGVLIEMSAECDADVKADVCMHIAAMNPPCLNRDDADPKEVEAERAAYAEEAKGKPPQIVEKIVDGKLNRWYSEFVLLDQPFVKDDKHSVSEYLKGVSPDLTVSKFVRYDVGGA